MEELLNISAIDGRYKNKTLELREIFSEYALIKYRLFIEIQYLLYILNKLNIVNLLPNDIDYISNIYNNFNLDEAIKIKDIEMTIQHDVKSIEYYIRNKVSNSNLQNKTLIINYIHFGLTSQDINSPSNMLMIRDGTKLFINLINKFIQQFDKKIELWKDIVIITKTHGQNASPSFLGKEFMVFKERIVNQLRLLINYKYRSKFGGAIGNFNAHHYAFKDKNIDWHDFGDKFLKSINLDRNQYTTQIDHYDNYIEVFNILHRINSILIDMCQDIWLYISFDYFKLKINKDEVGSSTMPHKVNPINFENAEGNLLLSNNLITFMSNKLPISRLQRDLTDSTILRNIGQLYSYSFIAIKSIINGLEKLDINKINIDKTLKDNYVVVGEGIQSRLKVLNNPNSYEEIKEITRSNSTNIKIEIEYYIKKKGDLSEDEKEYLLSLTPNTYTGTISNKQLNIID